MRRGRSPRFSELTVGLVGDGRIARRLAAMVRAMGGQRRGARSLRRSGRGRRAPRGAGLVARHRGRGVAALPLTAATYGLLDAARLGIMKPGAVLVNASRDPLIVQHDLLEALRHGVLAAAALDVFEREPPNAETLASVPNLLVPPGLLLRDCGA